MGSNNGSGQVLRQRRLAFARYGHSLMSPVGALQASLKEPSCDKNASHPEDRESSRFWDRAAVNSCRVILGLDPIEEYQ